MASLSDVAKAAGVSVTTASFVLNGHAEEKRISPQTAERVLSTARELSYVPNIAARKLTYLSDRSNVVPDVALMWSTDLNPEVLSSFFSTSQQYFSQGTIPNMHITIEPFPHGPLNFADLDSLGRHYNGILFSPSYDEEVSFFASYSRRIPMVVLHVETNKLPNVIVDNYAVGSLVADVFAQKKHTSAAILYRPNVGETSLPDLRLRGFRQVCEENNIAFTGCPIPQQGMKGFSVRSEFGKLQAQRFLETGTLPEAIFIQDDYIAAGFTQELTHCCIRIPEDIEIITYGGKAVASAVFPNITTVDYPGEAMSYEALKLLGEQIHDPLAAPRQVRLVPRITFRDSCSKPVNWNIDN